MIVAAILCLIVALMYWPYQAHKKSRRDRRAFPPYPQAPNRYDAWFIEQQQRDAAIEADFNRRVAANEARRLRAKRNQSNAAGVSDHDRA